MGCKKNMMQTSLPNACHTFNNHFHEDTICVRENIARSLACLETLIRETLTLIHGVLELYGESWW